MKTSILVILAVCLLVSSKCFIFNQDSKQDYNEYLRKIAKEINQKKEQLNWYADENITRYQGMTKKQADKQECGAFASKDTPYSLPIVEESAEQKLKAGSIPESFDAREQWPNCESVKEIRDQSACGSCWAFGGCEAFSDRWCIASGQKQQVRMSTQNLLSCCDYCGMGCHGGYNPMVWNYFQNTGVVTGDLYGDNSYCQPYSIPPKPDEPPHFVKSGDNTNDMNQTPQCSFECNAKYSTETYSENLYFTKSSGMIINKDLEAIQREIMTNGPVEVLFFVYEDFRAYKGGVYKHTTGDLGGGHAVKMLGWGVENGEPYWLCANSWGTKFGMDGFFKILRGVNECGIENEITYGLPDLERNRKN